MNLCIDIGNSSVKAALFESGRIAYFARFHNFGVEAVAEMTHDRKVDAIIVSSTQGYTSVISPSLYAIGPEVTHLTPDTPVPIKNLYATPETLGPDRLAAAVGAYSQTHGDTLIIDCGTAITYDFVNSQGEYLGGNISPGMDMRFTALHDFTARLPLVSPDGPLPQLGHDTETAIRCGVVHGIKYEIEQSIHEMLLKYPNLSVFFTGGTDINFGESIKNRIFADKYVVLKGLNVILEHLKK